MRRAEQLPHPKPCRSTRTPQEGPSPAANLGQGCLSSGFRCHHPCSDASKWLSLSSRVPGESKPQSTLECLPPQQATNVLGTDFSSEILHQRSLQRAERSQRADVTISRRSSERREMISTGSTGKSGPKPSEMIPKYLLVGKIKSSACGNSRRGQHSAP